MIDLYSSWLLRALVQSTWHTLCTFVVVFIIDQMLKHRSPQVRSWLWRAFYVKVIVVALIQLYWTYPTTQPLAEPSIATTSFEIGSSSNDPFAALTLRTPLILSPTSQLLSADQAESSPVTSDRTWMSWLLAIWCIGVFACVVKLLAQWQTAVQLKRRTKKLSAGFCKAYLDSLKPLAGRCRHLQMRMSLGDGSPFLVGLLKPFVVLPEKWLRSPRQTNDATDPVRMILAHELAHLQRNDVGWNLLVSLVHTFMFFNPVLWLTRSRYYAAQESACDELAIRHANLNPARYAELLIEVSRRGPSAYASPAIVPLVVCRPRKILFERLNAMQSYQHKLGIRWHHRLAIAFGFVFAALPWSVSGYSPVLAQTITLEDSSKAPSSEKPKKKTTKSQSSSSASASSGAFGFSGGSSSAGGNGMIITRTQVIANASTSDDPVNEKKSGNSPDSGSKASPSKQKGNSTRSSSMSVTRETNGDSDVIKVTVQEPARHLVLTQNSETGIEIRITPMRKGVAGKEDRVTAEDAAELRKKNPKAFAAYRKYLEPQLKGDGNNVAAAITLHEGPNVVLGGSEDAQKMMRKQLKDVMKNDAIDPVAREQIKKLIEGLPSE